MNSDHSLKIYYPLDDYGLKKKKISSQGPVTNKANQLLSRGGEFKSMVT